MHLLCIYIITALLLFIDCGKERQWSAADFSGDVFAVRVLLKFFKLYWFQKPQFTTLGQTYCMFMALLNQQSFLWPPCSITIAAVALTSEYVCWGL